MLQSLAHRLCPQTASITGGNGHRARTLALLPICLSAVVLTTLAGTAAAQDEEVVSELRERIRIEQRDGARQDGNRARPQGLRTSTVMQQTINGKEVVVRIENDEVSGTVDGKPLSPEQIQRDGNQVVVRGEDGEIIAQFTNPQTVFSGQAFGRELGGQGRLRIAPGQGFNWDAQPGNAPQPAPPPVMVGITMEEPSESLRAHFGLSEGDAILVSGVVDELPAAKAGLAKGDLIVSIAGQKPVSNQKLVEQLRTMEPGQTLELGVIQKGEQKTLKLELVAYEQSKLATAAPDAFEDEVVMGWSPNEGQGIAPFMLNLENMLEGVDAQRLEQMAQKLAEQLGEHFEEKGRDIEEYSAIIEQYFNELAEQSAQKAEEGRQLWLERVPQFEDRARRFILPRQPGAPEVPGQPAPPRNWNEGEQQRITEMEQRLEQRMERLEAAIERLSNQLADNAERRAPRTPRGPGGGQGGQGGQGGGQPSPE
jgi:BMFP domain-containing protein YqiC